MKTTINKDQIKVRLDRNSLLLQLNYGFKKLVYDSKEKDYVEKYKWVKVAAGIVLSDTSVFQNGELSNEFNREDRYKTQTQLNDAIDRLYDAFEYVSRSNWELSPDYITRQYKGEALDVKKEGVDLADFMKSILDDLAAGNGDFEKVAYKTIQRYKRVIDLMEEFRDQTGITLESDKLTHSTHNSFKNFIEKHPKGFAASSAEGILKCFIRFTKYTKIAGVPCTFDSTDERIKRIKLDDLNFVSTYLTWSELLMISNNRGKTERTENARRSILVMSLTGVHIGDLPLALEPKMVEVEGASFLAVDARRIKNGKPYLSYLPKPALQAISEGIELRSSQKLNPAIKDYLKELYDAGLMTEIVEVSSQDINGKQATDKGEKWRFFSAKNCRKTFSTNLISLGLNEQIIMRSTGHRQVTQGKGSFSKNYVHLDYSEAALQLAITAQSSLKIRGKLELADWFDVPSQTLSVVKTA